MSFTEYLPDIHSDLFVLMLHSLALTTSHSAIAISANEIAPQEELIERVVLQIFGGLGCKLQEPKYHVTVIL